MNRARNTHAMNNASKISPIIVPSKRIKWNLTHKLDIVVLLVANGTIVWATSTTHAFNISIGRRISNRFNLVENATIFNTYTKLSIFLSCGKSVQWCVFTICLKIELPKFISNLEIMTTSPRKFHWRSHVWHLYRVIDLSN